MPSSTSNSSVRPAQEALAREQTGLGRKLVGQGDTLMSMSTPAFNVGRDFYKRLVLGDRSELGQLLQPEVNQINDLYSGAQKNLEFRGVRGGERDSAMANLNKSRVQQIASLIPMMRSNAAGQLSQLGLGGMGTAINSQQVGGTNMGNAGLTYANLLNDEAEKRRQQQAMWSQLGGAIGGIITPWALMKMGVPSGGSK